MAPLQNALLLRLLVLPFYPSFVNNAHPTITPSQNSLFSHPITIISYTLSNLQPLQNPLPTPPPPRPMRRNTMPPPLLQLALRIHQPTLHPHTIQPILLDALTVQQLRQGALDLLINLRKLPLLLERLVRGAGLRGAGGRRAVARCERGGVAEGVGERGATLRHGRSGGDSVEGGGVVRGRGGRRAGCWRAGGAVEGGEVGLEGVVLGV